MGKRETNIMNMNYNKILKQYISFMRQSAQHYYGRSSI